MDNYFNNASGFEYHMRHAGDGVRCILDTRVGVDPDGIPAVDIMWTGAEAIDGMELYRVRFDGTSSVVLTCLFDETVPPGAFTAMDLACDNANASSKYAKFHRDGQSVFVRCAFNCEGADPNAVVKLVFLVHSEAKTAYGSFARVVS